MELGSDPTNRRDTKRNKRFRGETPTGGSGGRSSTQKESDNRGGILQRGLLLKNVLGAKERTEVETSVRLKSAQQIHMEETFQARRDTYPPKYNQTKRLDDKNRFIRRLPTCTSTQGFPEIPEIHMEKETLPIRVITLRNIDSTMVLHKNNERSGKKDQNKRNQTCFLPRRHDILRSHKRIKLEDKETSIRALAKPWMDNSRREMHTGTHANHKLPRIRNKLQENEDICTKREDIRSQRISKTNFRRKATQNKKISIVDRTPELLCSSDSPHQNAVPRTNEIEEQGTQTKGLGRSSNIGSRSNRRYPMVVRGNGTMERKVRFIRRTRNNNHNRCITNRLGRTFRQNESKRFLDKERMEMEQQYERIGSSGKSTPVLPINNSGEDHPNPIRQCYYSKLHQSYGRKNRIISESSKENLELVSTKGLQTTGGICSRKRQQVGRLPFEIPRSQRLETQSSSFSLARRLLGTPRSGHVRSFNKSPSSKVLLLGIRSKSGSHRRIQAKMGLQRIRKPSFQYDRENTQQDGEREINNDIDCTVMDNNIMVSRIDKNGNRQSNSITQLEGPIHTREMGTYTDRQPQMESTSMESVWGSLEKEGLSKETLDLIKESWRGKTFEKYASNWLYWTKWCSEKKITPLSATSTQMATFLTHLHCDKKLKYSTINVYRSAISTILGITRNNFIGQHEVISRVMKGIENRSPKRAKYEKFWDPGILLKHILEWGDNNGLSNEKLTKKVIVLMRLALFLRSSDLAKIIRAEVKFEETKVSIGFDTKKEQRRGHEMKRIELPRFQGDARLCPVEILKTYLEKTQQWMVESEREKQNFLVLSFTQPHHSLSVERLAKLMLEVMAGAGIDTSIWKAGSARGAAATKALDKGATVEDVMRIGQWSSFQVFEKFYDRSRKTVNILELIGENL
jgi:hypothetical protein